MLMEHFFETWNEENFEMWFMWENERTSVWLLRSQRNKLDRILCIEVILMVYITLIAENKTKNFLKAHVIYFAFTLYLMCVARWNVLHAINKNHTEKWENKNDSSLKVIYQSWINNVRLLSGCHFMIRNINTKSVIKFIMSSAHWVEKRILLLWVNKKDERVITNKNKSKLIGWDMECMWKMLLLLPFLLLSLSIPLPRVRFQSMSLSLSYSLYSIYVTLFSVDAARFMKIIN